MNAQVLDLEVHLTHPETFASKDLGAYWRRLHQDRCTGTRPRPTARVFG